MKIFITISTDPGNLGGNTNSSSIPVNIAWYFDDGVTSGGANGVAVTWSALSSATTLNAAVKALAIQQIQDQAGHTVSLITDQIFFVGGFIGL